MGRAMPPTIRRNEDWPKDFVDSLINHEKRGKADPYRGVTGGSAKQQHFDPIISKQMKRWAEDPFRGSKERRVIGKDEKPSKYELAAAQEAMKNAGVDPSEVDMLLLHSMVSDEMFPPPGNENYLHWKLGLPDDAAAWQLSSVCSSFTSQLATARAMVLQGMARNVLCITSCMYSRWTDYSETNSLYHGDGVAAAVVGPVEEGLGIQGWHFRTNGSLTGGIRLVYEPPKAGPNGETDMPNQLLVQMGPKEVQYEVMADLIPQIRICADKALERAGFGLSDIKMLITHQPTAWFQYASLEALGLPESMAYDTFAKYANLSSACLSVTLYEALQEGRIQKGDPLLLFSPHAGYGYGAIAMRWAG